MTPTQTTPSAISSDGRIPRERELQNAQIKAWHSSPVMVPVLIEELIDEMDTGCSCSPFVDCSCWDQEVNNGNSN